MIAQIGSGIFPSTSEETPCDYSEYSDDLRVHGVGGESERMLMSRWHLMIMARGCATDRKTRIGVTFGFSTQCSAYPRLPALLRRGIPVSCIGG
jgi:hypothetical protein